MKAHEAPPVALAFRREGINVGAELDTGSATGGAS